MPFVWCSLGGIGPTCSADKVAHYYWQLSPFPAVSSRSTKYSCCVSCFYHFHFLEVSLEIDKVRVLVHFQFSNEFIWGMLDYVLSISLALEYVSFNLYFTLKPLFDESIWLGYSNYHLNLISSSITGALEISYNASASHPDCYSVALPHSTYLTFKYCFSNSSSQDWSDKALEHVQVKPSFWWC